MRLTVTYPPKGSAVMWGLIKGAATWSLLCLGAKALYEHLVRRVKPDRVYTQREVARLLRVPVAEAVGLIESNRIPGQAVGSEYRVLGETLIRFLNARAIVRDASQPRHA